MFGTGIKTLLSSALVAATMFGASAPLANAANGMNAPINLAFAGQQDFKIQKVNHRHGRRHGYGHSRRHGGRHGYRGHGRNNYGCSPRRAVNRAWNMGLNNPHVKRVGKRHIVVKGGYRGSRAKVVFSRFGGCQVVNFERKYW
ncbi:MAG: hypothetical protein JKY83_01115 [Rhizobiaceae bacterium]|nr:hypothetical protein [Rhizobiaceae bacterium]